MNDLSPRRQALDHAVQKGVWGLLDWCVEHWLAILNTGAFLLFFLPVFVAPAFIAVGWYDGGNAIVTGFSALCHQLPERSFYLFGQQMGLCHRMAALHGFFFLFGMLYIAVRRRLRSLPTWLAVVYCLPLAVDGTTQLFGWRESTWELRVATGAFFALSAVWYVYPHLELITPVVRRSLRPSYA